MKKIKILFWGILFFPIRKLLHTKKNVWVFGSDIGRRYSQNSKALFEYVINNHPEIKAYWMTQSKDVYNELHKRNIPVINNISLKGIYYSLIAEKKIMSSWFSDILYTFPNKKQKVSYLMHGMPIKKIYYDNERKKTRKSFITKFHTCVSNIFIFKYKLEDSCFTPVTSTFFQEIVKKAMKNDNIYVTGQPRTDIFFHLDKYEIKEKYGLEKDSFIITYMPTHRSFGLGEPSPHVFANNEKAIKFFKENGITFIWKQHISMLNKYKKIESDKCFVDMSFNVLLDAQELLFISDMLITDFSSCLFDYMLLQRPILFYHYDEYEKEDNDIYYGKEVLSKIGSISETETDLLENIVLNYNRRTTKSVNCEWNSFIEYFDDQACERAFNIIKNK